MTDPCDWDLCCSIVRAAASHPELLIPVTVKIRLQPTLEATIDFAQRIAASGASLIAVHGRQRGREDRRRDGSADLNAIAAVVHSLAPYGVPVVTNGNVRCPEDVVENLATTGAAGIMVAEQILRDPAVFARAHQLMKHATFSGIPGTEAIEVPRVLDLVYEYVALTNDLDAEADNSDKVAAETTIGPRKRLRMIDNSTPVPNSRMSRATGNFERLSVWWTNTEVAKGHLKHMLGEKGQLVSRNTFKKAKDVAAVFECFRRRFAVKAKVDGSAEKPITEGAASTSGFGL